MKKLLAGDSPASPRNLILVVDDDPVVSGMLAATLTAVGYAVIEANSGDAIETAQRRVGVSLPLLETAKEIALSHQEKWDGSGYPEGLAGEAIPLSARLMAVADVYDAQISRRVYKKAMTHAQAVDIIVAGRGQHFDPDIADAFVALQAEFQAIAARFDDLDEHLAELEARTRRAAIGEAR
jgi:response regulator RpfG family c-di-GMP phosphodiesterase